MSFFKNLFPTLAPEAPPPAVPTVFERMRNDDNFQIGDLVPRSTISLAHGETALFQGQATLAEYQERKQYLGSKRLGASFRIAKGVSIGSSTSVPQYRHSVGFQDIGSGTLVVTDRRLAFLCAKKTVDVPLAKILKFSAVVEGIIANIVNSPSRLFKLDQVERTNALFALDIAKTGHAGTAFVATQSKQKVDRTDVTSDFVIKAQKFSDIIKFREIDSLAKLGVRLRQEPDDVYIEFDGGQTIDGKSVGFNAKLRQIFADPAWDELMRTKDRSSKAGLNQEPTIGAQVSFGRRAPRA